MPSQAAASIARIFPGIAEANAASYSSNSAGLLRGMVDIIKEIPQELFVLPPEHYEGLIVGLGIIEQQLALWVSRVDAGVLPSRGSSSYLDCSEAMSRRIPTSGNDGVEFYR